MKLFPNKSPEPTAVGAARSAVAVHVASRWWLSFLRSPAGRQCIFRRHDERQIMRLKIDRAADALYLRLDDSPIIESEEVSPGVVLDFNEQNQVVGVEMLNLSKRVPALNLKELQFQTA